MSSRNKDERQRRRHREKQWKRSRAGQTEWRLLGREEANVTREANNIIRLAQANEAHVATLGALLFFSTQTGDAWMLDPGDGLAPCLAWDGETQPFKITETSTQFGIEWTATYRIDGDIFIIAEQSGRSRTILGCPTDEISQAILRTGE
jgi:hypothetical protein